MLITSNHINATLTSKPTGTVISRIGTETVYVELAYRWPSTKLELVATRVDYLPIAGQYLYSEVGREIVDADDAIDTACDLEWAAVDELTKTDDRGWTDPVGFGEAVERLLDAFHAIAAE
jgi:hypothetical protein